MNNKTICRGSGRTPDFGATASAKDLNGLYICPECGEPYFMAAKSRVMKKHLDLRQPRS